MAAKISYFAHLSSFSSRWTENLYSSSSSCRQRDFACDSRSLLSSSSERARERPSSTVRRSLSCSNSWIISVKDVKSSSSISSCSYQNCCALALPCEARRYCRHLPVYSMCCLDLLTAGSVVSPLRAISQVIVECLGSGRPCL